MNFLNKNYRFISDDEEFEDIILEIKDDYRLRLKAEELLERFSIPESFELVEALIDLQYEVLDMIVESRL